MFGKMIMLRIKQPVLLTHDLSLIETFLTHLLWRPIHKSKSTQLAIRNRDLNEFPRYFTCAFCNIARGLAYAVQNSDEALIELQKDRKSAHLTIYFELVHELDVYF